MPSSKIKIIKAHEILDSRGNPTIEVDLETDLGIFSASVPSGASTGTYEAQELRDGGKRYSGKGVLKAIKNIKEIISPAIKGKDVSKQDRIDKLLIELDGTENKFKLGANAILAVSTAVCRAGAAAQNLPLYQYIAQIFNSSSKLQVPSSKLPIPCFNIINGGIHAGNDLAIQEFMVVPGGKSFSENLQRASEIYHNLKKILISSFNKQAINIGDEGGFAPSISKTSEALDFIIKAIADFSETKIGIDCAASQFFQNEKYHLDGSQFSKEELLKFYKSLVKRYPIIFFEDPFAEEDWEGWGKILNVKSQMPALHHPSGARIGAGSNVLIFGDDLTATNPERIRLAYNKKACNGVIIKPNQIGTVSETLKSVRLAKSFGWKIMAAHRSGETCDDFIADLAVGINADFIKAGAPARGERVAKYNRLLKIEEELKNNK